MREIEIDEIITIAIKAGKAIMSIYTKDFTVEYKDDKSPLTEADKKANEIILNALKLLDETIPILSEEGKEISYEVRKDWDRFWLVDPLDGTKEFIKKNGEFTVNIALIESGVPTLGVVYAPALDVCYYAKKREGAFKCSVYSTQCSGEKISLPGNKSEALIDTYKVVASRSHMSDETKVFIDAIKTDKEKEIVSIGSSLKLCLVAEGEADIYPRLGPTMEWDTAAAHAIVLEAGKGVYQYPSNEPLVYNKENLLNPYFVVR